MGKIRFSESAIKSSFLVENPDWYVFECTKVLEKASTTGSINYIFIFEGKRSKNAKNPEEMSGVSVSKLINEKADWVMYPMFKAANNGNDLTPETEVDPHDLEGVTFEAMCKRGQRQDGSPQNDLVDFRPLS